MELAIKTTVEISDDRTANVLCNAIEGGISYWCKDLDRRPDMDVADFKMGLDLDEEVFFTVWDAEGVQQDAPDAPGKTPQPGVYELSRERLVRGWKLCAEMYPRIFGALIDEDNGGDSGDADVFLQLCLFGKVVFG